MMNNGMLSMNGMNGFNGMNGMQIQQQQQQQQQFMPQASPTVTSVMGGTSMMGTPLGGSNTLLNGVQMNQQQLQQILQN